jgi:hypothetical protein
LRGCHLIKIEYDVFVSDPCAQNETHASLIRNLFRFSVCHRTKILGNTHQTTIAHHLGHLSVPQHQHGGRELARIGFEAGHSLSQHFADLSTLVAGQE